MDSAFKRTADDLAQGLEVIERNVRVQTQLIDDPLDMSRIEAGKVTLDVQRLDLPAVVEAALESVRPAALAKSIRLTSAFSSVEGIVTGDRNRLQQIVWNLLLNAIKFTKKGGRVHVTLERINSRVEIVVTDNGSGIAPEFLNHIFERFIQADASTTRQFGGLGLGLSIVKHLVELHGGRVRATSPGIDRGATFVVSLPLLLSARRPSVRQPKESLISPGDAISRIFSSTVKKHFYLRSIAVIFLTLILFS